MVNIERLCLVNITRLSLVKSNPVNDTSFSAGGIVVFTLLSVAYFEENFDNTLSLKIKNKTRVFDAFGLFPIPGDEHLCEYLPWVSDPTTKPWEKYELELYEWDLHSQGRENQWQNLRIAIASHENPEGFIPDYSEGALEIIENILNDMDLLWEAVNIPNQGQLPNLPEDAIIEVPGRISDQGVRGVPVGKLPEGIAELLRREITVIHLTVDSVVKGDRQLALQALLLDPVIRDIDVARLVLDDYLATYHEHLPSFWN